MRQIDLGLNFFWPGMRGPRAFCGAMTVPTPAEVGAHFLGLMLFKRTGVGLLLSHADFGQHIENRFTFYFQLSGQIVNSNLTHPPLSSSALPR